MKSVPDILIKSLVPKSLRFEFQLAARHLVSGGGQTIMTISAVAAGVIIVVFVTSLIFGLQERQSELLTGYIPHITIRVKDPQPRVLEEYAGAPSNPVSSRIEEQAPQLKFIDNWEEVVQMVRRFPGIKAVTPSVSGQGFAWKGAKPNPVSITGADPVLQDAISPVTENLLAGRYLGLSSDEIVIDSRLAEDLSISVGERVRLTSSGGVSESFTIAGIYSSGGGPGRGSAYVTLRTGQSLFGYGISVNSIQIKLVDLYEADELSQNIMALTPYEARPWTTDFSTFLTTMMAMSASAYLISAFSLLASSFAIASVLIVSVLQKSEQIGILKSMGARQRQILVTFVLEGLGVAILGSTVGAAIGIAIVYLLSLITSSGTQRGAGPAALFPSRIIPLYIGLAMLAAIISTVIAAVLPARRAARLNPVDVMR